METAQHTEPTAEKSFDVLASVNLYRHDLAEVGFIRPETRQRVYDEELSYIAEGINRPNYTEFVLNETDGRLVFFHNGRWTPYISALIKGLRTAEAEAAADPRKSFEAERRAADLRRGYQLQSLRPGEKMAWYYEFPHEQMARYGREFIESLGFYPGRAMGYICEAEKTDAGLILRHQSVDNSDSGAFGAAMFASRRGAAIEGMTRAYDSVLEQKYSGDYYAGRPIDSGIAEENAWAAVVRHRDLVEFLLAQIEVIAGQELSDHETAMAKERLTYGVWARLKEKISAESYGFSVGYNSYRSADSIQTEIDAAYTAAAGRGEVLFGCGGSIAGEKTVMQAPMRDVFDLIFGNEKKWFGCPFCGAKQYGDPCASHLYCPSCTAEVKNGKLLSEGKTRTVKKGFLEIISETFSEEWDEWNRRYDIKQKWKRAVEQRRRNPENIEKAA